MIAHAVHLALHNARHAELVRAADHARLIRQVRAQQNRSRRRLRRPALPGLAASWTRALISAFGGRLG